MTESARRINGVWWFGKMPIPATAMWTGERDEGCVRPCRYVDGRPALWCPDRPGLGRPMFKCPHPVRQRRAMRELRCDICAKALRDRTKYRISLHRLVMTDGGMAAPFQEPLLCGDCVPLAREHCPHVARLFEEPGFRPAIFRRGRYILPIVTGEAMELTAGLGVYPPSGIIYLKMEQLA